MYKYPYLNRSLEDMDGEHWKPIRGYNDMFFVSNFGRVKSFTKSASGKIIAQRLYNKGELLLSFKISLNHVEKEYRTAAIVYETFIGELDFKIYNIGYKDGNSFNLHPSNLKIYKRYKQVVKEKRYYKQQLIAATASMYKYPYENLSLADMEGEIWKPFADQPDYYAVSNKGRVKSLEREYTTIKGKKYVFKSKILKQRVQINFNPITKEKYYHLSVHTTTNYIKREYTISRLVYEAFIALITPNNPSLIVRHKDNNHLNNTPENLYLSTRSELQNNMLMTGKRHWLTGSSDISKFTHEDWVSRYDTTRKPVSQFDLDGNFIRTFASRQEAANVLGLKQSASISNAALSHDKIKTVGGFRWRNGIDRTPMEPVENVEKHLKKACQPKQVGKYDLEGHLLNVYPSVVAAARENKIKPDHLYSYIYNPQRIPRREKRFLWKYIKQKEESDTLL